MCPTAFASVLPRVRAQFDYGWRFERGEDPGYVPPTCNSTFPLNFNDMQCMGLNNVASATSAEVS